MGEEENNLEESRAKEPKDPKGSARGKYNRRKTWLAHALHQMDVAIDHLLSQEGAIYKRHEIDTLKAAIATFVDATGLTPPELKPPSQEELDAFSDLFESGEPWKPDAKEDLEDLLAVLGLEVAPDDQDSEDAGDDR